MLRTTTWEITMNAKLVVLFAWLWAAPAVLGTAEAPPSRPNFLLIIADDLCWRDLGFTGNREVRTPNIDRLRSEGMYLQGMFTPATTCSPSRHALYTGLYCVRAGAYPNHTRAYDGTKSMFTHLKERGYRVALQNKTHVGPPATFPYEHITGADDLTKARAFITRDKVQPWLFVFASNDPHGPWTRGPQDLYDPARLTVPPYLHDNAVTRKQLAAYYAEITQLDEQVGALMKLLDETQQAQNTLVMFISEQGSSFPYGGKWLVYDNGIRVATVVCWPGRVKPGSSSEARFNTWTCRPHSWRLPEWTPCRSTPAVLMRKAIVASMAAALSMCCSADPIGCGTTYSLSIRPSVSSAIRSRIPCGPCAMPATS